MNNILEKLSQDANAITDIAEFVRDHDVMTRIAEAGDGTIPFKIEGLLTHPVIYLYEGAEILIHEMKNSEPAPEWFELQHFGLILSLNENNPSFYRLNIRFDSWDEWDWKLTGLEEVTASTKTIAVFTAVDTHTD